MTQRPNRNRVFEKVVSIEAWHTSFDDASNSARVHVDVSFLKARIGEEDDSPVRFDLTLKRAEIVFIVPATEPLRIIQSSVAREQPRVGQAVISETTRKHQDMKGSGSIDISKLSKVAAAVGMEKEISKAENIEVTIETQAKGIEWAQSRDGQGNYKWDASPGVGHELVGKVWDAVQEPLLSIKGTGSLSATLKPMCRIEVRCKREDIILSNLQSKRGILEGLMFENKRAAAEAFIRNALSSRDLRIEYFNDPYGDVTLADIVVEEEVI